MFIAPMALLALAIWAAWTMSRHDGVATSGSALVPATFGHSYPVPTPRDGAERIARDRLTRGEISVEDYERIISVLRG